MDVEGEGAHLWKSGRSRGHMSKDPVAVRISHHNPHVLTWNQQAERSQFTVWNNKKKRDLRRVDDGAKVRLCGRVRMRRNKRKPYSQKAWEQKRLH